MLSSYKIAGESLMRKRKNYIGKILSYIFEGSISYNATA